MAGVVTMPYLVEAFTRIDVAESTAVLHLIAAFTDDDLLRRRIRDTLATRRQPMPPNVGELSSTRIQRAVEVADERRVDASLLLDVMWPDRTHGCATISLDHNRAAIIGGTVSDIPFDEFTHLLAESVGANHRSREIDLAEASALLAACPGVIELEPSAYGDIPDDDDVGDQWPANRHLISWLIALLPPPDPASGPPEPLDDDALDALVASFFAAEAARGLDRDQTSDPARRLFAFASETGDRNPLRWDPDRVHHYLTTMAEEAPDLLSVEGLRALLPSFIEFCDAQRGIADHLTTEAVHDIHEILDLLDDDLDGSYMSAVNEGLRAIAHAAVGGPEALQALDAEPLPAEPLDLTGIEANLHDRIRAIGAILDQVLPEFGGVEELTACRRVLSATAVADPAMFRQAVREDQFAADVAALTLRANLRVDEPGGPTMSDLAAAFGVNGVDSSRMQELHRPLGGVTDPFSGAPLLGDARFLVSEHRATVQRWRDNTSASTEAPGRR
ncbi:MAG: hypothetical protein Q4G43_07920 [Mobilicoccus sp.]|nr:hypothetical protein [Mobilicoccus sp.]